MKKILLLIIIILCCISCGTETDNKINKMISPVIVIAISRPNNTTNTYYCIVLKDSTGKLYTLPCQSVIAEAIGKSKHVGDTIR